MWDLIVVGGGAAGLWAAGTAAQRSLKVLLLEKNTKLGVKILMSGGTRCNVTHDCGIDGILSVFGKQGRFLKPSLHELPPAQVVAEMHRWGVRTKVESTGKVFPASDRAIDVRDALVKRARDAGAVLRSGIAVQHVDRAPDDLWRVTTQLQKTPPQETRLHKKSRQHASQNAQLQSRRLLLCCGGLSYAGCGTTGDGYAWAEQLGHRLVPTCPALTPLVSPATWVHSLTGITLPDVRARITGGGRKLKDERAEARGGLLWTHFGCSGPVPMNVSRTVAAMSAPHQAELEVDLVPDWNGTRLTEAFSSQRSGRRLVATQMHQFVPKNLAACLLQRASIPLATTLAELTKGARQQLLEDLKRLRVPISGTRGYPKAEVTRGGVDTGQVNPRTMESRVTPGLFLAGEILDIDGPIGGYNFQAAFSTGHAAAKHV